MSNEAECFPLKPFPGALPIESDASSSLSCPHSICSVRYSAVHFRSYPLQRTRTKFSTLQIGKALSKSRRSPNETP